MHPSARNHRVAPKDLPFNGLIWAVTPSAATFRNRASSHIQKSLAANETGGETPRSRRSLRRLVNGDELRGEFDRDECGRYTNAPVEERAGNFAFQPCTFRGFVASLSDSLFDVQIVDSEQRKKMYPQWAEGVPPEPLGYYEELYFIEVIFSAWDFHLDVPLLGDEHPESSFWNVLHKLLQRGVKIYFTWWSMTLQSVGGFHGPKEMDRLIDMGIPIFLDYGYKLSDIKRRKCTYKTPQDSLSFLRSAHAKKVIINREIAYVGGIDISKDRAATPSHHRSNPKRKSSNKDHHGTQARITGQAAADIASIHVNCWRYGCHSNGTSFFTTKTECKQENLPPSMEEWKRDEAAATRRRDIVRQLLSGNDAKPSATQCRALVTGDYYWLRTGGYSHPVTSVYDAYLSLIKNAQSYVYIENQYIVSAALRPWEGIPKKIIDFHTQLSSAPADSSRNFPGDCTWESSKKNFFAKNHIAIALYRRIKRAIRKKKRSFPSFWSSRSLLRKPGCSIRVT
ncbi:unnamed protein product [Vitrella brassicaformis CCMP3155]|uniref:phospholipase D n=1 Tax=Vitrella brassicaformis (strain CCMP3155) TaxID=1169540 RepID=A0A0G4FFY2_VITBC|nr:unnamed protein product [Vitrella brassicaformis CCMP3155]|eukprot:CEM11970.1 unnamed protein product [Vitrella brassicaformis CCMP3155]